MSDITYLAHHGVKGQKWGVRRYQNEDGSYTDAGRVRYGKQAARKYYKIDRLKRKQENTESFSKYRHLDKKIRKVQTRYDRKVAGLTSTDIDKGRLAVSSFRASSRVNVLSLGAGMITGGALLVASSGAAAIPYAAIASAAGGSMVIGASKKLPYYHMESNMYRRRIASGGK